MGSRSPAPFHETFDRFQELKGPSDRRFGVWFAAIFAGFGLWQLWHRAEEGAWWIIAGAAIFAAAVLRPSLLRVPNRLWQGLGVAMFKVVSPIVMALLFYGAVLPTALCMRLAGRDPLSLKWARDLPSYWVLRDGAPQDMRRQF
jgi:hypothetical protein